jgi:ABC-type glutathione transport system ATPase component
VTHDIDAVKGFCDKAMWLDGGNIISNGLAKKVAEDFRNYMLYGVFPSNRKENEIASAQHDVAGVKSNDQWLIPKKEKLAIKKSSINIEKYRLIDQSSIMMNTVKGGQNLKFQMQYSCQESDVNLTSIGITIHDGKGRIAAHINSSFFSDEKLIQSEKLALAEFDFEFPPLNAGEYSISFSIDGIKEVEDELLIKYDYDSHLKVEKTQEKTVRLQAGYVIVNKCSFKVSEYE